MIKYIAMAIFALYIILRTIYIYLSSGDLAIGIRTIHEYGKNDPNNKIAPHFHNNDLFTKDFKETFNNDFKEKGSKSVEWSGRSYLFIPKGKLGSIDMVESKLARISFNGISGAEMFISTKHSINKKWVRARLTKYQISNYNGPFITEDMYVKTGNLNALRIDGKKNDVFKITYYFDNGTKRTHEIKSDAFYRSVTGPGSLHNAIFLASCDVIELN